MNSMLGELTTELEYAVLDFETTGMSPAYGHRVCEVGVQVITPDFDHEPRSSREDHPTSTDGTGQLVRTLDEFQQLIDPEREIDEGARQVNGITRDMVKGQPRFPDVCDRLLELIRGRVVVAHNAPFDLNFLRSELEIAGRALPEEPVADSCRLARNRFHFSGNSLANVAREFDVDQPSHRALDDVRTLSAVWGRMLRDVSDDGVRSLGDLIQAQGGPIRLPSPSDPESLPPEIKQALLNESPIKITYENSRGNRSSRRITPKRTTHKGKNDYVIAYCHRREDQRTFRLDRIVSIHS